METGVFSDSTAEISGNVTPITMLRLKVHLLILIAHLYYIYGA